MAEDKLMMGMRHKTPEMVEAAEVEPELVVPGVRASLFYIILNTHNMEEKFIYIQKDTKSIYVEFDFKLDNKSNFIGKSWDAYKAGGWVLLTEAQLAFKVANPEASVQEVFEMQLTPMPEPEQKPERTAEDAKREKLIKIDIYDNSDAVNSFSFAGQPCWINAQERATYNTSIQAAELLGESEIEIPLAGQFITMQVAQAKGLLALIQRYADKAAIVTGKHKATVLQLADISVVDAYDHTAGYPDVLTL
ncbi:MAG: hypothetical protein LBT83_02595 [Tannerella sp.]|nr:hypothetical protein [Tannerella sp.]